MSEDMKCKCGEGVMEVFDETPKRIVLRCEECHFTINTYKSVDIIREIVVI